MLSTPGKPRRRRVIAYFDGYNLYHGIRDKGWNRFLWLDLPRLAGSFLLDYQDLILTKYFTARISSPESKRKRQSDYLEALEAHCGASLGMYYGRYQSEPWTCSSCGKTVAVPHEKKTDVNIAVELMTDAFRDEFDTALLVSADSDLVPPILAIKRLFPEKRIVIAFPPARWCVELKNEAHVCIPIGRAKLSASQLPEVVTKIGGQQLLRPSKWSPPQETGFGQKLLSALEPDPDDAPE